MVTAATDIEIKPFLSFTKKGDIIITGIGIPSTVYHLTRVLAEHQFDFVIQAGIAGTFHENYIPGQVFAVEKDTFADIGAKETGKLKSIFDMRLVSSNTFPFQNGWLENRDFPKAAAHLPKCNAVTVNTLSDDRTYVNHLKNKFSADIESMEGAAFHYVCLQQKVPFMQLRSISNQVGERDKTHWHMEKAIANLNAELINLFTDLR